MSSGAVSAAAQVGASDQPVLVATKLHAPQPRPGLVPRPELVAELTSAAGRSTLDSVGAVGFFTSATLGTDGLVLISYSATNGALRSPTA